MKVLVLVTLLVLAPACAGSLPSPEEVRDQTVQVIDRAAETLSAFEPVVMTCPHTTELCVRAHSEFLRAKALLVQARRAVAIGESAAAEVAGLFESLRALAREVAALTSNPPDAGSAPSSADQ